MPRLSTPVVFFQDVCESLTSVVVQFITILHGFPSIHVVRFFLETTHFIPHHPLLLFGVQGVLLSFQDHSLEFDDFVLKSAGVSVFFRRLDYFQSGFQPGEQRWDSGEIYHCPNS